MTAHRRHNQAVLSGMPLSSFTTLSKAAVRELRVRAVQGYPVDHEDFVRLADAMLDIFDATGNLDDASNAAPDDAEGAGQAIRDWAKEKKDEIESLTSDSTNAEEAQAKAEEERDEARKEAEDLEERLDDSKKQVDVLKEHVEELEGKLKVHLIGKGTDRELVAELEGRVTTLEEENDRLKMQCDRAADFWRQKAREELFEDQRQEIRRVIEEQRDGRREVQTDLEAERRERRRLWEALVTIVARAPEDAHRLARVAIGRELLEVHGSAVEESYIPTRAERRAQKKRGQR